MNSNPSQHQSQQQSGQDDNAAQRPQRADHAPDISRPAAEPGRDGAAPGKGDSNRTPWQGQQPVNPAPRQQGNAVGRKQQQQGSFSEDTDDAGDTVPNDDIRATGND